MDKYKNPFMDYNKPSMDDSTSFGFGNYGYRSNYEPIIAPIKPPVHTPKTPMKPPTRMPMPPQGGMPMPMPHQGPTGVPIQIPMEDHNGLEEWDRKRMKALYPRCCKKIQFHIDEACNKREHSKSLLYDEYLERELIEMMVDQILKKVMSDDEIMKELEKRQPSMNHGCPPRYEDDMPMMWLRYLVHIMLINEIFSRRKRRQKGRRKRQRMYLPTPYYYNYPQFFQ